MTTTAPLPPLHTTYTAANPDTALTALRTLIEGHITNQPRSLQKRIGPSEIGTPCDHCLAAKLAGWEQTRDGVPWLPWVGTCVHAGIETAVITHENTRNAQHSTGLRYLVEAAVMVGTIGGQEIWGHTDLFDLQAGLTVDWKIVGPTTLRTAKAGPTPTYRTQAHLYAKGWNDAGYRVDHVAIAYLPRNAPTLDNAIWWHEPHDRAIADAALARADRLHTNLTALTQAAGDQARDAWIATLARDAHCYDCARYPDAPAGLTPPGHHAPQGQFQDLLP